MSEQVNNTELPVSKIGAMKKYEIITEWIKANINELAVITCDPGLYNFMVMSTKIWNFTTTEGNTIIVAELGDNYYIIKPNITSGEPATEPAPANQ